MQIYYSIIYLFTLKFHGQIFTQIKSYLSEIFERKFAHGTKESWHHQIISITLSRNPGSRLLSVLFFSRSIGFTAAPSHWSTEIHNAPIQNLPYNALYPLFFTPHLQCITQGITLSWESSCSGDVPYFPVMCVNSSFTTLLLNASTFIIYYYVLYQDIPWDTHVSS